MGKGGRGEQESEDPASSRSPSSPSLSSSSPSSSSSFSLSLSGVSYPAKELERKVVEEADVTYRRHERVVWEACMKILEHPDEVDKRAEVGVVLPRRPRRLATTDPSMGANNLSPSSSSAELQTMRLAQQFFAASRLPMVWYRIGTNNYDCLNRLEFMIPPEVNSCPANNLPFELLSYICEIGGTDGHSVQP
ncbi:hypothetical protein L210DRAFT_3507379 [Boletus edulis BED1]|uniref:Uncharacterized protein n=1 Tax=Boletus edulis BED1 TaxID=1328754 RepID=A0AAD4BJH4_BOLED|nr:hypothetical protein L210DRAFT_3507379 [Boletus edulis BED1]